ncbi:MAG: hypothetical protein JWM90_494 [Thermoleophilia bacterium]|nr:hypothetical protein [Thermoleophilia bacterium]
MASSPPIDGERGSSLVEYVLLGAAAATLLVALSTSLGDDGDQLGGAVGVRLGDIVAGRARGAQVVRPAEVFPMARGTVRGVRERRTGGGTAPARVGRDDLRLSPTKPARAIWQDGTRRSGTTAGTRWTLDASACALCIGVGFEQALTAGGTTGRGQRAATGLDGEATAQVHAALAAVEARAGAARDLGSARVSVDANGRALVGADAELTGNAALSATSQSIDLRAGAMAGAVARGKGRVGIELLGVAIEQSAAAEGWAGAGARGTVGVHRTSTRVAWTFGWGVGLGLGGAVDWSGSIDVSRMPARHRALARSTLRAASSAALPLPFRSVPLLLPH